MEPRKEHLQYIRLDSEQQAQKTEIDAYFELKCCVLLMDGTYIEHFMKRTG